MRLIDAEVSIHATLAGGDLSAGRSGRCSTVSIHATLAGGDATLVQVVAPVVTVSIHATLAGGDYISSSVTSWISTFLSTPPSRVATIAPEVVKWLAERFYPRHPRGWRPAENCQKPDHEHVSIHATLAGGDSHWQGLERYPIRSFYPRHPRGWRRAGNLRFLSLLSVSIHATLAGGDFVNSAIISFLSKFLSTPPSRVATGN